MISARYNPYWVRVDNTRVKGHALKSTGLPVIHLNVSTIKFDLWFLQLKHR